MRIDNLKLYNQFHIPEVAKQLVLSEAVSVAQTALIELKNTLVRWTQEGANNFIGGLALGAVLFPALQVIRIITQKSYSYLTSEQCGRIMYLPPTIEELFTIAVLTPIREEFMCRSSVTPLGLNLQKWLIRNLYPLSLQRNRLFQAITSETAIFGLAALNFANMHGPSIEPVETSCPSVTVAQMVMTLAMGIWWNRMANRSGGLAMPIGAHMSFNLLGALIVPLLR